MAGGGQTKEKEKIQAELVILGGGAAGMMAAISAARAFGKKAADRPLREEGAGGRDCGKAGERVHAARPVPARILILEHKDKPGKKIYATGNGRCNFTNGDMSLSHFRGDQELISAVLGQFGRDETLALFRELGVFPKEKNGYYYPASMSAAAVAEALTVELRRLGVWVMTEVEVGRIAAGQGGFRLETSRGQIRCGGLIIATGLLAAPKLGSDGSALELIKSLGHRFTKLVPALCGFYGEGMDFRSAAGVRTEGRITLFVEGEPAAQDEGELQFTDYGISGIPVFQVSRFASLALAEKKSVTAGLDLFPSLSEEELCRELVWRRERGQGIGGLLNQKLLPSFCVQLGLDRRMAFEQIEASRVRELAGVIKHSKVTLLRPRGYDQAQVCAGGLRPGEVDGTTLESRITKRLYFCGEVLNVDGICGGYNLQWAWSSGYVAGRRAACDID